MTQLRVFFHLEHYMATLPQSAITQDKTERIGIRCTPEFKKAVAKAAIDQDLSIEAFCVELIAKGLGVIEGQSAADDAA